MAIASNGSVMPPCPPARAPRSRGGGRGRRPARCGAAASDQVRLTAAAAPGRPSARAGGRSPRGRRVAQDRGALEQRGGIEGLVGAPVAPHPRRRGSARWHAGVRGMGVRGPRPSGRPERSPRPAWTTRPARRRDRRRPGRPASDRAGTGTGDTGHAQRPGARRGRRARPAYPSSPATCSTVTRSTSRGRRLGDGDVEPPDRLRAAEDEEHPRRRPGSRAGPGPPRGPSRGVADRRAGQVARHARCGPASVGRAAEGDREVVGEPCDGANPAAGHDIAVPQDDRDAAAAPRRAAAGWQRSRRS